MRFRVLLVTLATHLCPPLPLFLSLSLVHTLSILMWGNSLSSTSSERVYCARTELCLFCFLFFFFLSPFYDFTSLRERAEEKEEGEGERAKENTRNCKIILLLEKS